MNRSDKSTHYLTSCDNHGMGISSRITEDRLMKSNKTTKAFACLLAFIVLGSFARAQFEEYYHLLYKFEGYHASQTFGRAVYLTNDVTGDGCGDILVGADGEDIGQLNSAGRVFVYSGFDGELLYVYDGEETDEKLGRALSDIGDTDGDGLSEFLIGYENADFLMHEARGKVYHCSGLDGSILYEYMGEGTDAGDNFGCDVEGLGDADGDGCGDFIVGADCYDEGQPPTKRGAVYVYSGRSRALLYKYEGEYQTERLGCMVCRTGDVDLDGLDDFAYLTLYNHTRGRAIGLGGRVTVCSGADGSIITEIFGYIPETPLCCIEYGGDINGDGWPDLLVGQPGYENGSIYHAGRAFVYSGKDWTLIYTYVGCNKNGMLGSSLSTAGDLDDDGCCDFLVGARGTNDLGFTFGGAVYVHSGNDGSQLGVLYGDEDGEMIAASLHGGGDVNADGLPDIIIGTSEDINGIVGSGSVLVYAAKSLHATDQVPLGSILELNMRIPAMPLGIYYLAFSLGAEPGMALGTRTIPLNADVLFSITFGNPAFIGNLDPEGEKQVILQIPIDPALSGLIFYSAFMMYDQTAPKLVKTISNPEEIEII